MKNSSVNIEVWDIEKLYPRLSDCIDDALRGDLFLSVNYHPDNVGDLSGADFIRELLREYNIPHELNISFGNPALKGAADYAG